MPPLRGRDQDAGAERDGDSNDATGKPTAPARPLRKGAACLPCAARRVRCSAERPACAACIRHARWSGKDPRTNHGCSYKPSIEDEEEIETEEGRQLRAAKSRISELEARIAELESLQIEADRRLSVDGGGSFLSRSSSFADSPPSASYNYISREPLLYTSLPSPQSSLKLTTSPLFTSPNLSSSHPCLESFSSSLTTTSIAPAALSLGSHHHIDPVLSPSSFSTFTPPSSAEPSPSLPIYHDVPTTLNELLSMPFASALDDVPFSRSMMLVGVPGASLSGGRGQEEGSSAIEEGLWSGLQQNDESFEGHRSFAGFEW